MRFEKHHLLYFGPLTVLIELIAVAGLLIFYQGFSFNKAISTLTTSDAPWPLLFGVLLTIVSVAYALFTLPLRAYSPYVPYAGIVAGIAFTLTGWIPFAGDGSMTDVVHNISSCIAVGSYTAIIGLMQKHPKHHIGAVSKLFYRLLLVGILLSFISTYITHRYLAFVQLLLLVLIQTWTVLIVWYERRPQPTPAV